MPKNPSLKKALMPEINRLFAGIEGKFVAIPATACECGKPVVFIGQSQKFTCSRCGHKWALTVQVSRIE